MEELKKKNTVDSDKEIVFSKSVKAGKRIYYLDVKKNRKDEMYLAITESKKVIQGEGNEAQVSFEKHKIFLYKEDFEKFITGLTEAINFIDEKQGPIQSLHHDELEPKETETSSGIINESSKEEDGTIKLDIEF
jgi:hypothetical protein